MKHVAKESNDTLCVCGAVISSFNEDEDFLLIEDLDELEDNAEEMDDICEKCLDEIEKLEE